jgi:cytochrome c553
MSSIYEYLARKGGDNMNRLKIFLFSIIIAGLAYAIAFAGGNVEQGKALFNDPTLSGATSGKSCGTCHQGGKGLEEAGEATEFQLGGAKQGSLEEAINLCIVKALKGNALDPQSQEMQDLTAYIKSLSQE